MDYKFFRIIFDFLLIALAFKIILISYLLVTQVPKHYQRPVYKSSPFGNDNGIQSLLHEQHQVFKNFTNIGMTNTTNTKYFLKHSGQTLRVGDYFSMIIEARDSNNNPTLNGGDFWFAKIGNQIVTAAGKITDFNNGTYEATFLAVRPGFFNIEIILVHPSETTYFMEKEIWPMKDRVTWLGTFTSNKMKESKQCGFAKEGEKNGSCVYRFPLAMGKTIFVCSKPKNPRLTCDTLVLLDSQNAGIDKKFERLKDQNNALFGRSVTYARILNGPQIVNISTGTHNNVEDGLELPTCKPDLPTPLSDGFWVNGIWTSLQCKSRQWTTDEIRKCVNGKRIYLFGDSTTRQWNAGLIHLLGLDKSKLTKIPNIKLAYHYSPIVNLTFHFHPYTIARKGCPYRIGRWEYEIMDNLNSSECNYIILISPWAHYTQWVKDRYIERLLLLQKTILRLRERCPNTVFVVKSPKPRNHKTGAALLYGSDKLVYDIRTLFYKIFSGMDIHMIDVWDMNLASKYPNVVHMPMAVIYQELQMFFSHIC